MGQIAYLDGAGALLVDDPFDSETPRQLAPAPPSGPVQGSFAHSAPAWSPDGTRVAYTGLVPDPVPGAQEPVYHSAVFVVDQDGGNRVQVTFPPDFRPDSCDDCEDGGVWSDWAPTWSPDGTKLAFIRLAGIGQDAGDYDTRGYNVWVADVAGGGDPQQVTQMETDNEAYASAVWSPDGSRIAALKIDGSGMRIVTVNSSGGSATPLTGPGDWTGEIDWTPDGTALVATRFAGARYELVRIEAAGGAQTSLGTTQLSPLVRATTDGNGALYRDCDDGMTNCGLHVRRFDDPDGDLHTDEPLHELWAQAGSAGPPTGPLVGSRSAFDIQPQQLPVIFVPGFLGSEIQCGGTTVWPMQTTDLGIDFPSMELDLDGTTDTGCAGGAGPTGDAVGSFDAGPVSQPVYRPTADYMSTFLDSGGAQRGYVYGWDWRKAPQESLAGLDALIDEAISRGVPERQGVKRVALYGHSYGGLLIRTYLDDPQRADRVERVVTVGTPWWGSPKAIFPLAFGIETPEGGPGMDWFADNAEMRDFARNLAGLYQLFPSPSFGPWLQRNGVFQNQDGVSQTIFELGGTPPLFRQAEQNHLQIYDEFFDDGGRIDVRAIVGTGLATFGTVDLRAPGEVEVDFVNGDRTVPGTSATQDQTIGAEHPAGDPGGRVHVQEICGVEHMEQSSHPRVLDRYGDFLDHGRRPRRTEGTCGFSGFTATLFTGLDFQGASLQNAQVSAVRARAFAGAPMTLREAAFARLIDVAAVPGQWIVAMSDRRPVALTLEAQDLVLDLEPVSDAGAGPAERYGPMSGTIAISPPATPGDAPVVTDDGVEAAPEQVDPGPGPDPDPGPGPGGGGGPAAGGSGGGSPAAGGPGTALPQPLAASLARIRATRMRRLLKRGVRTRLTCSAACRGKVTLELPRRLARRLGLARASRRAVVIGRSRVRMRSAGTRVVKVTVKRRAKRRLRRARRVSLRMRVSLAGADGARSRAARKVVVRR